MVEASLLIAIGISMSIFLASVKKKILASATYWGLLFLFGISLIYVPVGVPFFTLMIPFSLRSMLDYHYEGKAKLASNWTRSLIVSPLTYSVLLIFQIEAYYLTAILCIEIFRSIRHFQHHNRKKGIALALNSGLKAWWVFGFLIANLSLVVGVALYSWFSSFELVAAISTVFLGVLAALTTLRENAYESTFGQPKYQKSSIDPAERYRLNLAIDQVFRDGIFYRSFDASLNGLAKLTKGTTHQVSQIINESKGMTFGELVVYHRVRDAKKLLAHPEKQHLSIEGIAAEVGYASKAAFNKAFKKSTGQSPSEFRASNILPDQGVPLDTAPNTIYREPIATFEAIKNSHIMLSNFFKIFFRNLSRNGLFSFLNVLGLTIGFSCSILIYLYIQDELSYDQEIPDYKDIYRITWQNDNPQTRTPHPMAQAIASDFPEVEAATSMEPWYGPGLSLDPIRVKNLSTNTSFEELGIFFADSTFLDVFQLKVLEGDEKALSGPSIVISSTMAKKYFGDSSAVGRQLEFNGWPLPIAAVVEPLPEKAHFHFQALISYVLLKENDPENPWFTWADFGHFNYIRLRDDASSSVLQAKIPQWVSGYLDWSAEALVSLMAGNERFVLQPIASIHLHSNIRWELENNGNAAYVYILLATLIFLLLIAAINYINLTTAKSVERAKEVGIRKTLGGTTTNLSLQFYFETISFCLMALGVSLVLVAMILPEFNFLSGKEISAKDLFSPIFLIKIISLSILVGLVAAFYPAMALSSFEPIKVLKGKLSTSSKGTKLRGSLVILQFAISAIMISGSLVIFKQLRYMQQKDLGFDQEAVISLNVPRDVSGAAHINVGKWQATKTQIESISGVRSTALCSTLPGGQFNQHAFFLPEVPANRVDGSDFMIDFGYEALMGLEILSGRAFDRSFSLDSTQNILVNEAMAKALNLGNPVGRQLIVETAGGQNTITIIGVVKDFHFQSLHSEIQPLVMSVNAASASNLLVKLDGNSFQKSITQIQAIYENMIDSEIPFEYQFLDESLADLYHQEVQTLSIFSIFSGIALILASMGLLGMSLAVLNQRIKEVGVRKILGASSLQILQMILSQFLKLISIALLIGLPVSYILMQAWAQEFSYRAPDGIFPFVVAAVLLLLVAVISIASAILKISFSNPAKVLRYE